MQNDINMIMGVFQKELASFEMHDQTIKNFTIEILKNVPSYFFSHDADGKENYILAHTKSCCAFAESLFLLDYYREKFQVSERDCIRSALLLHDAMIYGAEEESGQSKPKKYTVKHEHPELMYIFLKSNSWDPLLPAFVRDDIAMMVATHSGQWNVTEDNIELKKPKSEAENFVHQCVYLASKQECTVSLPVTMRYYENALRKREQKLYAQMEAQQQNGVCSYQAALRIVQQMTDCHNWDGNVYIENQFAYVVLDGYYVPVAEDLYQAFVTIGQARQAQFYQNRQ